MVAFPSSPTTNQEYTEGNATYVFTGSKWKLVNKPESMKGLSVIEIGGAVSIDLSSGNFFEVSYGANTVITFDNPPAADETTNFKVLLKSPEIKGYSLADATYTGKYSSASGVTDISITPDGTMVYVLGYSSDIIYQHALSTPWDISTRTSVGKYLIVTSQDTAPIGMFFKPDGTAVYVVGLTNNNVYQYTMSVPWDISMASYANKSFSLAAQGTQTNSIFFKPDGTAMYTVGVSSDSVRQYTLSTPWDISTASYANKTFYVGTENATPVGLFIKSDGTAMYITGTTGAMVYGYTISTPWDVTTASYSNTSFSFAAQGTVPYQSWFKPDGGMMYIVDYGGTNAIYQYSTSDNTSSITWPSNIYWQEGVLPILDSNGQMLIDFTSSDGGTTYYAGTVERDIE